MTIDNGRLNRGAVLLAELKALLESFPRQLRIDVVQTLKIVFRGLDADSKSRHSVHLHSEANSVLSSHFREAADLSNERHSENQKQKKGGER